MGYSEADQAVINSEEAENLTIGQNANPINEDVKKTDAPETWRPKDYLKFAFIIGFASGVFYGLLPKVNRYFRGPVCGTGPSTPMLPPVTPKPSTDEIVPATWNQFTSWLSSGAISSVVLSSDALFFSLKDGMQYVTGLMPDCREWLAKAIEQVPVTLKIPQSFAPTLPWPGMVTRRRETSRAEMAKVKTVVSNVFASVVSCAIGVAIIYGDWRSWLGLDSHESGELLTNHKRVAVNFSNVIVCDKVKLELLQLLTLLRNPRQCSDIGVRVPRGVLLVGPSGTGKTLLARAVAGQSNMPFFYASASQFVELYTGQGASRVRKLFARARAAAPCVVFIDEIDAIGSERHSGSFSGELEHVQTLNQLLTEMDQLNMVLPSSNKLKQMFPGISKNVKTSTSDTPAVPNDAEMPQNAVLVIGATNRYASLDSALIRPGRFDKIFSLNVPDVAQRISLCKMYSQGKKLREDISITDLAESLAGWTGADIEWLFNEAAMLALSEGHEDGIEKGDIDAMIVEHERRRKKDSNATSGVSEQRARPDILTKQILTLLLSLLGSDGFNRGRKREDSVSSSTND